MMAADVYKRQILTNAQLEADLGNDVVITAVGLAGQCPVSGPSATRQTAARVAVQTVRRCVGAGTSS